MGFRVAFRKENITAVALMQQATYANIQAYRALRQKDFASEATQKEHWLLSEQILRTCGIAPIVREFSCRYDEGIWEPESPGLSKSYRIEPMRNSMTCRVLPVYELRISFEKPLKEASQVRIQFGNTISEFVTTNIFNVEFVEE